MKQKILILGILGLLITGTTIALAGGGSFQKVKTTDLSVVNILCITEPIEPDTDEMFTTEIAVTVGQPYCIIYWYFDGIEIWNQTATAPCVVSKSIHWPNDTETHDITVKVKLNDPRYVEWITYPNNNNELTDSFPKIIKTADLRANRVLCTSEPIIKGYNEKFCLEIYNNGPEIIDEVSVKFWFDDDPQGIIKAYNMNVDETTLSETISIYWHNWFPHFVHAKILTDNYNDPNTGNNECSTLFFPL